MLLAAQYLTQDITQFHGLSALGQRWQWRTQDNHCIDTLTRELELPDCLARILTGRGQDASVAMDFLHPSLKHLLPDPFHLRDMDKAVNRLYQAITRHETIAVFGDYDVDGATSSALLIRYFRQLGIEMLYHIPDRQKEGYGPNATALLHLQQRGVSLVLTVDCGAVSFEPLTAAAQTGLDVIVLDHHKGSASLPPAVAVVNPNRLDETTPYTHLAAVGVVFLTLVGLQSQLREAGYFAQTAPPDLLGLLDLVALGTVCDVVPLTTINRAFVVQGLKIMAQRRNGGLAALMDNAGVQGTLSAAHLGFALGPRINAGGRVGQADMGVRLLISTDEAEQQALSAQLSHYNNERKVIEQTVLEQAMQQAEAQAEKALIFVAAEGWHPGVIGIVASRIKERFNRPCAVIALENGQGKASARSVHGVDIGSAITMAREAELLLAGGGHAMAGGFSLDAVNMQAACNYMTELVESRVSNYLSERALKLDAQVTTAGATSAFIAQLERAAPFGMGNPSPVLVLPQVNVIKAEVLKEAHIRVIATDASGGRLKAMSFRSVGTPLGDLLLQQPDKLHLAGSLKLDYWQGREQICFVIDDAMNM